MFKVRDDDTMKLLKETRKIAFSSFSGADTIHYCKISYGNTNGDKISDYKSERTQIG